MTPNEIVVTPKIKAILKDKARYMLFEGVTGSGKSFVAGLKIFLEICASGEKDTQFVVAGQSQSTIEKTIIDNPASFYNIFKAVCEYKPAGVGGAHIKIYTTTGYKKLYFVGYRDKARWKDILGLTLAGIWIEEVNIADDDFVRECFTRAVRTGAWIRATCNGAEPDRICYTEFFNKGRPLLEYEKEIPPSTIEELHKMPADINYRYWFWHFRDNPTLTQEQIAELYTTHPVGSFYYNTKILGVRAETEGVLYAHILNNNHTFDIDRLNYNSLIAAYVGVDIGSGGAEGTAQGNAKTVITLTGVSRGNQRAVVIDALFSEKVEQLKLIAEAEAWLRPYYYAMGNKLRGIYVDSAERTLIETWRNNKRLGIDVYGSIKQNKAVTGQTRVRLKEQLLLHSRLLFSNKPGAQEIKRLLGKVKGKNGETLDENMLWNDVNDSLDYSLTPRFHELLAYRGR